MLATSKIVPLMGTGNDGQMVAVKTQYDLLPLVFLKEKSELVSALVRRP